jgi:hypothetical protein
VEVGIDLNGKKNLRKVKILIESKGNGYIFIHISKAFFETCYGNV